MAYTFPMDLADFFDGLKVSTQVFDLSESVEMGETGGGDIITADYGPRLWGGTVSIAANEHYGTAQIVAKIDVLREAGSSFFVYDKAMAGPAGDPYGATLAANQPSLIEVASNNKEIRINGLPSNYQISAGDKISFPYGSNPVRYALHKFVEDRAASGGGTLALTEIRPHVRPGYSLPINAVLVRPFCKAKIVPGSVSVGSSQGAITSGVSFEWRQTLR